MQFVWRLSDRTVVTLDGDAVTVEGSSFFAEWLRIELGLAREESARPTLDGAALGPWIAARARDAGLRLLEAESQPDSLQWLTPRRRSSRLVAAR